MADDARLRIDRLHIVVTIEQYVRPPVPLRAAIGFGDDGGMTGRRPDFRREAERRNILGKMIGRRFAIPGEGGVRRDRFDPQQGK
jgi:hypothetical protein